MQLTGTQETSGARGRGAGFESLLLHFGIVNVCSQKCSLLKGGKGHLD